MKTDLRLRQYALSDEIMIQQVRQRLAVVAGLDMRRISHDFKSLTVVIEGCYIWMALMVTLAPRSVGAAVRCMF